MKIRLVARGAMQLGANFAGTAIENSMLGACHATVVEKGDFLGHPESLAWSKLPGSPVKLRTTDITNFEVGMIVQTSANDGTSGAVRPR